MSLVLPSTVEELNYMQSSLEFQTPPPPAYVKDTSRDFENIASVNRIYKREYSLPNGVAQWNVHDFEPYLNFDDNIPLESLEVNKYHEDRLVPGDEQRQRSESFSSVSSSMDDKTLVYHNMGVKTFNTVCMDSGSTCISSDHAYVNVAPSVFKDLDSEETFQNLHPYITQGPEVHTSDTTSSFSSAHSPLSDNLELSILSNISAVSNEDNYSEKSVSLKRSSASPDSDVLLMSSSKRFCESPSDDPFRYLDNRKKNNIASKNCRKTRKEKQKEMEVKVTDLEKENDELKNTIRYLEHMTAKYKKLIEGILKPRQNILMS